MYFDNLLKQFDRFTARVFIFELFEPFAFERENFMGYPRFFRAFAGRVAVRERIVLCVSINFTCLFDIRINAEELRRGWVVLACAQVDEPSVRVGVLPVVADRRCGSCPCCRSGCRRRRR